MIGAQLTPALAANFAATALDNIRRPLPQRVDRVQTSLQALKTEQEEHPAFHGSFDWHSCVHMHWLLARLMHLFPNEPWQQEVCQLLDERLSVDRLQAELAYFQRPENLLFERPYGWAWLFKLLAALRTLHPSQARAQQWTRALLPLAELLVERLGNYLLQLQFPVRAGTHGNTAFAMLLALELERPEISALIETRARGWFLEDRDYPADYEPDGEDFLSGGLVQAALMSRLLEQPEFQTWWTQFKPQAAGWTRWQQPLQPASTSDGRLVHLAGLNLSRAWCLRLLAPRLPSEADQLDAMAQAHLQASLPHVTGAGFAADHWLASFALLALAL